MLEFVAGRLTRYKMPKRIEFTDEPLRDEAGKVRRSALRQARLGDTGEPETVGLSRRALPA